MALPGRLTSAVRLLCGRPGIYREGSGRATSPRKYNVEGSPAHQDRHPSFPYTFRTRKCGDNGVRARSPVNHTLSSSIPEPLGHRHHAHKGASDPCVTTSEAQRRVRGRPYTLADGMSKRRWPTKIASELPSHTLHASKCRENGMRARSVANYMLSWSIPGPLERRHPVRRDASDPCVVAPAAQFRRGMCNFREFAAIPGAVRELPPVATSRPMRL